MFGQHIRLPDIRFCEAGRENRQGLEAGGRFVVKYVDGFYKLVREGSACEGVYQETPKRIAYRFKEYLPEIGAIVNTIRNETRGEEYDRKGYIYTLPMVHLTMRSIMELAQHIGLDAAQYLDVFVKTE